MFFLKNKNFFQKIIISLLIIIVCSFVFSSKVKAKDEGAGGKLLRPVTSLLLGIDDGIMDFIHNGLIQQNKTYIRVDLTNSILDGIRIVGRFIANAALAAVLFCAAVAVVPALLAAIAAGGVAVAAAAGGAAATAIGASAGIIAIVSTASGVIGGYVFSQNNLSDDMVIPLYYVTPEEIISGKMAIFDADFFNPDIGSDNIQINAGSIEQENGVSGTWLSWDTKDNEQTKINVANRIKKEYGIDIDSTAGVLEFKDVPQGTRVTRYIGTAEIKNKDGKKENKGVFIAYLQKTQDMSRGGVWEEAKYFLATKDVENVSIAYKLRPTIASWYKTLRNIAIVGSLSILIYIAIRIIISSSSADKSKYKQRLYDWLVSICLIFVMHYIMAGSNIFVKQLSGLLNSVEKPKFYEAVEDCNVDKIKDALEANKYLVDAYFGQDVNIDDCFTEQNGKNYFGWNTNLMGIVRLKAQSVKDKSSVTFAGYTIMFTALTIITGIFTWTYLKRIAYLALLTILAPFVAMTYALDKLKDGSAQGFNNWFKEYLVNLMIQPIHLLLYTVLVSSALELAETNLVYSIVAIAFIMPSEKLVRRFFGINATETQGLLSGAAGGALAMAGLNRLLGHRPQGPKDDSGKGDQNKQNGKITFKDSSNTDNIFKKKGDDNSDPGDDGSSGSNDGSGIDTIDSTDDTTNSPGTDNGPDDGKNGLNDGIADLPYADVNEDAWNVPNNNEGDVNSDGNIKPAKLEPVRQQSSNSQNKQQANQTKKKQLKPPSTKSSTQPKPSSTQSTSTSTTSDTTSKNDLSKFQRAKNGLARGLKFYGRGALQNIKKDWKPGSGIEKGAKAGLGFIIGTAGVMEGASAGIATGDAKSTWQDATALGIAAYKFGSAPNLDVPGVLKVENAGEYFARGYYGDEEYERRQDKKKMEKMIEEKMNDEFVKQFSTRTKLYDENKAKEALKEDNLLEESLKHGFYDANEIAAVYKAKKEINNQEDAFAYTQIVKDTGVDINTFEYDRKKKEAFIQSLEDKYKKANKGKVDEEEMNKAVNTIYGRLKQISDVYHTK